MGEKRRIRICKTQIRVADGRQQHGGLDGKKMSPDPASSASVRLQERKRRAREREAQRQFTELRRRGTAVTAEAALIARKRAEIEGAREQLNEAIASLDKRRSSLATRVQDVFEKLASLKPALSRDDEREVDALMQRLEDLPAELRPVDELRPVGGKPMVPLIDPEKLQGQELPYFYWFRTLEALEDFIRSVPVIACQSQ